MHQDDQLPPNPQENQKRIYRPVESTLPPFDTDMMELEEKQGRRFSRLFSLSGWSPTMAIGTIFIGSFLIGVFFTSAILSGLIEIHPAAIKGFFKTIFGKS